MANRTNHPGRKSDREWYHALRKAVHELIEATGAGKSKRTKALHLLARKLVSKALGGDVMALKELGDRLDGKPRQALDLDVTKTITLIERRIVDVVDAECEVVSSDRAKSNGVEPVVPDGPAHAIRKLSDRR